MKQQDLKVLLGMLIDSYLIGEIKGKGYRIDDYSLDVKINYVKPEWWANIRKAYRIESVTNICREITIAICKKNNVNPTLFSELYGFVTKCYSSPSTENITELILRLFAVHVDLISYKSPKTVIINQKQQPTPKYATVYHLEEVTPYDIIPVRTAEGTYAMNISKFIRKFDEAKIQKQDFTNPQKLIEIRKYVEESLNEDQINDIFNTQDYFTSALYRGL